jgi:ribonuclease J
MPLADPKDKKKKFDSFTLRNKTIPELLKEGILPPVNGLYAVDEKPANAVLISHPHQDHYGLLNYVHKDIPVYMSQGAQELIEISSIFTPHKLDRINSKVINAKRPFIVGDIKITPYLVDHSAFDALAFLIEADGKRIFYSGDFRGHGRKSILFERIVKNPPQDIDCLLMEGSIIGRGGQQFKDEGSIQARIEEILKSPNNITFLFSSSQNIDRLVSAYKACLKTDSIFVIDIYTAYILDKLRKVSKHIPQFNWRNIRVKFYKNQADTLANKVSTKLLYHYNSKKIDLFEINKKKSKVLMLARDNSIFPSIVKGINAIIGAKIIYSMWEGYLSEEFKNYCRRKGLVIEQVHTSGHATIEDLKIFANAIKPKKLVPMHTFYPDKYKDFFENVRMLKDGETLTV